MAKKEKVLICNFSEKASTAIKAKMPTFSYYTFLRFIRHPRSKYLSLFPFRFNSREGDKGSDDQVLHQRSETYLGHAKKGVKEI